MITSLTSGELSKRIRLDNMGLDPILQTLGHLSLSEYLSTFHINHSSPIQSSQDLIQLASQYTQHLLGDDLAQSLSFTLGAYPVLLTANHHGVDYAPLCLHGSLLYSLGLKYQQDQKCPTSNTKRCVIPVFAYGSVPLNNSTYPRGILLSRKIRSGRSVKINIFPSRLNRTMVSVTNSFTESLIFNTIREIDQLLHKRTISTPEHDTILQVLTEEYLRKDVLQQTSYSDQSVLLNNRLWKKMFADSISHTMPQMVYLEMEKLVSYVLELDMNNPNALVYRVFFDKTLRNSIFHELDGYYGCWDLKSLMAVQSGQSDNTTSNSGTMFFWGVDSCGRRIHLRLIEKYKQTFLTGMDDSGQIHEYSFTPKGIVYAIKRKLLIPSLLTTFIVVSFARGFKCFGGPWQVTYLPRMQYGFVNALMKFKNYVDWGIQLSEIPTRNLIAGLTVVMALYSRYTTGAGLIEIATHHGLNNDHISQICQISLKDAMSFFILSNSNSVLPVNFVKTIQLDL
ncbi:MAG: hypothetical protein HQK77_06635 [Desulfobacterales bacterium]|nr:hypothetical protein [Desulfobacterales bacterium]